MNRLSKLIAAAEDLSNIKKVLFTFLLVSVTFCSAAYADGRAKIALSADGTYVDDSSNPWLEESWVTHDTSFDLEVQNLASSPIYLARLVVSIPYGTPDTGWSFTIGNTPFTHASFTDPNSDANKPWLPRYVSSHGIFAKENGALWTEYVLGTLAAGQTTTVSFNGANLTHPVLVHFDAYGSSSSTAQNGWYKNAYSHDVTLTATPEPFSAALFLIGGLALSTRKFFRKKT